jgi:hypothetical protein
MKIFIYKITHKHDPDKNGVFGNEDCMGRLRNGNYDAVIGIGGLSPLPKDIDIKGKINWVGLIPRRTRVPNSRGDLIVFSHFALYEEKGKDIKQNYPELYKFMYKSRCRFVKTSDFPKSVQNELDQIIKSVQKCPPSKLYNNPKTITCKKTPKHKKTCNKKC